MVVEIEFMNFFVRFWLLLILKSNQSQIYLNFIRSLSLVADKIFITFRDVVIFLVFLSFPTASRLTREKIKFFRRLLEELEKEIDNVSWMTLPSINDSNPKWRQTFPFSDFSTHFSRCRRHSREHFSRSVVCQNVFGFRYTSKEMSTDSFKSQISREWRISTRKHGKIYFEENFPIFFVVWLLAEKFIFQ